MKSITTKKRKAAMRRWHRQIKEILATKGFSVYVTGKCSIKVVGLRSPLFQEYQRYIFDSMLYGSAKIIV